MIKVRVKVRDETGSFAVVVCAGSLREAERIVTRRYPESAVGVAIPIEPDHYFVEAPHRGRYADLVVTEGLGAPREDTVARA